VAQPRRAGGVVVFVRAGLIVLLAACAGRTALREAADENVGHLARPNEMSSGDARVLLGEACPRLAVLRGRHVGSQREAWCENARGRLHGAWVVTREGPDASTTIGHYHDGVADGKFDGPAGQASYTNGRLDGPCQSASNLVTYSNGDVMGPFMWWFSSRRGDREVSGTVRGTFVDGVAVGDLVVHRVLYRVVKKSVKCGPRCYDFTDNGEPIAVIEAVEDAQVSIEPGVPAQIDGAEALDFAELLGPEHRGWIPARCAYRNDDAIHRAPRT
jgi:hypothetical protein